MVEMKANMAKIVDVDASKPNEQQWLVIYTDYGYAAVDREKFKEQLEEIAKQSQEFQDSLKDHWMQEYANLEQAQRDQDKADIQALKTEKKLESSDKPASSSEGSKADEDKGDKPVAAAAAQEEVKRPEVVEEEEKKEVEADEELKEKDIPVDKDSE